MRAITRAGNKIEGTLVPFAGPRQDGYGTWWNRATDFALGLYAPHPLLYFHGIKDLVQHGTLLDFGIEGDGLAVRAEITRANSGIFKLVDEADAAWSSGSMLGVASPARADGYIARWPIVEGSIAEAGKVVARGGITKAGYVRASDFPGIHLRSIWTGADMTTGQETTGLLENTAEEETVEGAETQPEGSPAAAAETTPAAKPEVGADDEQAEFRAWKSEREKKARALEIEEVVRGLVGAEGATRKLPASGKAAEKIIERVDPVIRVASEYDDISLLGMAVHYESKASFRARGTDVMAGFDDKYFRALASKVEKQWDKDKNVEQKYIPSPGGMIEIVPMRAIDESTFRSWNKFLPNLRADEAMTSTLASKGDELVPNLLSSTLYYFIRLEALVAPLFDTFMMTSQPFDYPKITKGPTFVSGAELEDAANFNIGNSAVDYSQLSTGKVIYTAGKLSANTLYSEELVEDSAVAFAEAAARVYVEEMAHALDFVLLNGDKSDTVTNISFYGTKPSAATATKRILTMDGIRHGIAAADQTAIANLADDSILTILATMGSRGVIGRDIRNLVCICPPEVAYKLDALSAYESLEKVGEHATLLRGQLGFWRSVPLIVTEDFPETDANGRVDDTPASNSVGSFIVAHRGALKVGMKRLPMLEQGRVPGVDGNFISASMRADVNLLEAGAAALAYNVTV